MKKNIYLLGLLLLAACANDDELEEKLDAFLACPDACLMVCEIDSEDRVK